MKHKDFRIHAHYVYIHKVGKLLHDSHYSRNTLIVINVYCSGHNIYSFISYLVIFKALENFLIIILGLIL